MTKMSNEKVSEIAQRNDMSEVEVMNILTDVSELTEIDKLIVTDLKSNASKKGVKSHKIAWTEATWNPITGCTQCSPGCANCYAKVFASRKKGMEEGIWRKKYYASPSAIDIANNPEKFKYRNGFAVTLHPYVLDEPKSWKKPSLIFVCSMSDLFHVNVPFEFIDEIMKTINETPQHKYQILTKRADRMHDYFQTRSVPENVWLGVSVDVASAKSRIDYLRTLPAKVKYLSCEPLLQDLQFCQKDLEGIDWVICGGEAGPGSRPMQKSWVVSIMQQCKNNGVKFFFKQWGMFDENGVKGKKADNGRLLNGQEYNERP